MSDNTLGVNESNGIPYLEGNDNIINIIIDPPLAVDLSTFNTNQEYPYINGDRNIVTINLGGASYAFKDVILDKNNLIFTTLMETKKDVSLPDIVTDITRSGTNLVVSHASGNTNTFPLGLGTLENLTYKAGDSTLTITQDNGDIIEYWVFYDEYGVITSIQRKIT